MDDQDLELTQAEKAILREVALLHPQLGIGNAILKLQARGDRAEFYNKHDFLEKPMFCCAYCLALGKDDPRHNFTPAQWKEAAQAELREVKG